MPGHVLITGFDHPHKGKVGKIAGEPTKLAGVEMVQVELDTPGIGGATACYAEPRELMPATSDAGEGR